MLDIGKNLTYHWHNQRGQVNTKLVPFGAGVHGRHVSGNCIQGPRGQSWINNEEVEYICNIVQQLREGGEFGSFSIGVVTPFKAQMDTLAEKLDKMSLMKGVTVGTAHRFQGDERDVMIFSPVIAKGITESAARWVEKPRNLINVAVTRARESLFVVGDFTVCRQQPGILGELVRYVETVTMLRETSEYELELFSWMVVQGWNPEVHSKIADIEIDFVLTHKGIRLAIEVDGRQHEDATIQDATRDSFLMSHGYRVLRFKNRAIRETPATVLYEIAKTLEMDQSEIIVN